MPGLTAHDVLLAYAHGLFPMAAAADAADFHWYDPPVRAQLPIETLHIPKRLRRTVLKAPYDVIIDTNFAEVIDGCAAATPARSGTWINAGIRDLFIELHKAGFAHSVECYKDGVLAGGLYGLALGGAFFGESMFSRRRDASKVALVHLCARLQRGGFVLLDAQFTNPHLEQFGVYEIPQEEYRARLRSAMAVKADFMLPCVNEKTLVSEYVEHINPIKS